MIKATRRFQNTANTASLRLPLTKRFLTHGQEWKAEPVHATRHSSRLGAKQLALIGLRKHLWPAPHLGSNTFCSPPANTCMILCMGWLPMVCWPGLPFFWSRHYLILVRWTPGSSFMDLWHCGCTQRKARLLCTGSLTPKLLNLTRKLENSSAQQVKCWVFVKFWRIMWNYAAFPMDYVQLVNCQCFLAWCKVLNYCELLCGNSFIAKALPQTLASIRWTSIGFYHQCRLVTGVQAKDALGSAFLWCFEAPWSTSWGLVFGKEAQGHQEACKFTLQHLSLWKFFACFSDCWAHPFIGNTYGMFQRWVFLGKCQKANQEDDEHSSKQWLAICW